MFQVSTETDEIKIMEHFISSVVSTDEENEKQNGPAE
jgi:hypothetical protein